MVRPSPTTFLLIWVFAQNHLFLAQKAPNHLYKYISSHYLAPRCALHAVGGKMATATPIRPDPLDQDTRTADFTRPQEPFTPNNLTRAPKRQQRALNITAPPRLDLGGSTHTTTASKAIGGQLDEIERKARVQRTVMRDFASIVDHFVLEQSKPEEHSFTQDLCGRIIGFLTTSLHAAPTSSTTGPMSSVPAPVAPASYADMAKTLRNSGADIRSTKAPRPTPPARGGPTPISGTTEKGKKRDN